MSLLLVPLTVIDDNPFQKRQEYGEIDELAARIRSEYLTHPETRGLLQVPAGRLVADDGERVHLRYLADEELHTLIDQGAFRVQLAFGHRRRRAFECLQSMDPAWYGDGKMPVRIVDLSDEDMLDAVWSENHDRKDISAVEEAELLWAKLNRPTADGKKRSQRDVADEWRLGRSTVANRIRVLDAPEGVKDANRKGLLSERQVLALLPIYKLSEMESGDAEWGNDPNILNGRGWGWNPPKPADFLDWVITEEGSQVTSDQIREYLKVALRRAGQPLPEGVAQTTLEDDHPYLYQPSCRGCEYRIQDFCINEDCFVVKKQLYARSILWKAADELGLEISEDEQDFRLGHTYEGREKLEELREAGGCEHLVVGWDDSNAAFRPFTNDPWGYMEAYALGSRAGVVLGHQGRIMAGCWPEEAREGKEEIDLGPDLLEEKREEWAKAAERQAEAAKNRVIEALGEQIRRNLPLELTETLVMLMAGDKYSPAWPAETLGKRLITRIFERGLLWTWREVSYPEKAIETLERLCKAANLPPTLYQERTAQATAIRLLAKWSKERRYDYNRAETAAELEMPVAMTLAMLEDEIDGAPVATVGELAELAQNLRLVEAEIAAVLEPEEE